jgi:hypothetical protein
MASGYDVKIRNVEWMFEMWKIIVLVTITIMMNLMSGCHHSRLPEVFVDVISIPEHDASIKYDAYLTWKNIGKTMKDRIYIWNGHETGKGEEGIKAILNEFEKMSPSSKILVYPANDIIEDWYVNLSPLVEPAKKRKIMVILSKYDEKGREINP